MSVSASTLRPAEEAARQVMVDEMVELQVIEPAGSATEPFAEIPAKARWPVLPSVFSTYFVIPKADGGYRGCLDCRYLNQYIESIYFKMDSLSGTDAADVRLAGDSGVSDQVHLGADSDAGRRGGERFTKIL